MVVLRHSRSAIAGVTSRASTRSTPWKAADSSSRHTHRLAIGSATGDASHETTGANRSWPQ